MNINQLVEKCRLIALNELEFKSFNLGNEWDQSTQKGDSYPNIWMELPILTEYTSVAQNTKQFTFSIVFLTMPKVDDVADEVNMISHMEEYADIFLRYLKNDRDNSFSLIEKPVGLTVKTINADYACGIRLDIKVNTGRNCTEICEIEEDC